MVRTGLEWASTALLLEELRRRIEYKSMQDSKRPYRCAACGEDWQGDVHFCGGTVGLTGGTPEMF